MNWNNNVSIRLSQGCIIAFAVVLLFCDCFAFRIVRILPGIENTTEGSRTGLMVCIYLLSVPAWFLLVEMWRLLRNISRGDVFTTENVSLLRWISICCAAAVVFGLVGTFFYHPMVILAVAAAFMMLIVRIVRNVFRQAVEMRNELDLTI